jgi:predicted alpha/beta-hydrolase family hydrolase
VDASDLLVDGPKDAATTVVLAHGAGAPMDSSFMNVVARGLATAGLRAVRFEFPYMRARRTGGKGGAPDRPPVLRAAWLEVIEQVRAAHGGKTVIGGKSLGGRIASLVADEAKVDGLVCLGYPFHPPGDLEKLRTKHLADLATPALIVQGTRDTFGRREEIESYTLSKAIRIHYLEDGDHSWKPRVASGRTEKQNVEEGIAAVVEFVGSALRPFPGKQMRG